MNLSFLYTNIRSLLNKWDELMLYISDLAPDLIAVTETWLSSEIPDSELCLPGYSIFRADRCGRGGGVLLLCKTVLGPMLAESFVSPCGTEEGLSCSLKLPEYKVFVALFYRSPGSEGQRTIDLARRTSRHGRFVLLGDFNAPGIDWEDGSYKYGGNFASQLADVYLEENMMQHVRRPTRWGYDQSPSTIDLILTSDEDCVDVSFLPPVGKSDHALLHGSWRPPAYHHVCYEPRRNIWKTDVDALNNYLDSFMWEELRGASVEEIWSAFLSKFRSGVDLFTPLAPIRDPCRAPLG